MLTNPSLSRNTPGVYFEWLDRAAKGIDTLRTDIAGFVGITARGPLHTPVKIESWTQFTSVFGGPIPQAYLAYAVEGFYKNGGQTCWVVRVADPQTAATGATQLVDLDQKAVLDLQAATPGSWAGQLTVTVIPGGAGQFSLALRLPDGAQETWRNLTLKPPSLDLPDASGQARLRLVAAYPEAWKQKLAVTVEGGKNGRFSLVLQPARQGHGPRNDLRPIGNELAIWNDLSLDPGDPGYFVTRINARTENPYLKAKDLPPPAARNDRAKQSPPGQLRAGIFALPVEPRFAGVALNDPQVGSRLVRVTHWADSDQIHRPPLRAQRTRLQGGKDGLSTLTLEHLIGDYSNAISPIWGLAELEAIDEISMLSIPDLMTKPVAPARHKQRPPRCDIVEVGPLEFSSPAQPADVKQVVAADSGGRLAAEVEDSTPQYPKPFLAWQIAQGQQAMIYQCEKLKDRVAILDAPDWSMDHQAILRWRESFETRYAALYYPWISVQDSLELQGLLRAVPPSGHVAGIYASTDLRSGVHHPPANRLVEGASDVSFPVDELAHGDLNSNSVNVIRAIQGRGIRLVGARTLSSLSEWRFVNVRRLLIMIEESIEQATQWIVFEGNNPALWADIDRIVRSFLDGLWRRGMLDGETAEEAYRVICDETTNPPEEANSGHLVTEIGVQPPLPAEFVIVRIGKTQGATEIEEGVEA